MKRPRRHDITAEVIVGAFMFIIIFLLASFTILISKNSFFKESFPMVVRFNDVGGLKVGESVYMRGVKVGVVGEMQMIENQPAVNAIIELEKPIRLREDYAFEVQAASMLGGMKLVVIEGSPDKPWLESMNNLIGQPPANILDEATKALEYIRNALDDGGIMQNLSLAMDNLQEITSKLNQGTGTVARLINDDEIYTKANDLMTSLQSASDDLAVVTQRITDGKGTLGKLMSEDSTLYDDLQVSMANLKSISTRIEEGKGTVGKLLSEEETLYNNLVDASESFKNMSDDIASLGEKMNSGQGTVGKLMNDDELYDEIKKLVENASNVMGDAQATIDDFRETSPLTTFSSILFGAF
ncbi:MAG: phospholipid/cholesterol/gamma-HCH transport system substrate-binding protein [Kiritimatiellia bacterium]